MGQSDGIKARTCGFSYLIHLNSGRLRRRDLAGPGLLKLKRAIVNDSAICI